MELLEKKIAQGDTKTETAVTAMVYQIAKEIGAQFVAAGGSAEAIILTGGLVRSRYIRDSLRHRISRLAPVFIFQESLEMAALAAGAINALTGQTKPHRYRKP